MKKDRPELYEKLPNGRYQEWHEPDRPETDNAHNMKQEEEKCCGGCCWFFWEDTDGWGECIRQRDTMNCSDICTNDGYVSREKMRHYMAVLLQANRWRRDKHVPAIYKMVSPTELGKAIDFACIYMQTVKNL